MRRSIWRHRHLASERSLGGQTSPSAAASPRKKFTPVGESRFKQSRKSAIFSAHPAGARRFLVISREHPMESQLHSMQQVMKQVAGLAIALLFLALGDGPGSAQTVRLQCAGRIYNATPPAECCGSGVCGAGLKCAHCPTNVTGPAVCAQPPFVCCGTQVCGAGLACIRDPILGPHCGTAGLPGGAPSNAGPSGGPSRRQTRQQAIAQCQRQYGARFLRVIVSGNGFACQYCNPGTVPTTSGQCATPAQIAASQCRAKYGARFMRVIASGSGFTCQYCNPGSVPTTSGQCATPRQIAESQCRARYGARFMRVIASGSGYTCQYCNPGSVPTTSGQCATPAQIAESQCRAQYGARFLRIIASGGGYSCQYCNPGTVPSGGRCVSAYAPHRRVVPHGHH